MSTAALYTDALPFDMAARSAIAAACGGTLGADEIVVDLFAGGGGATCGVEAAGLVVHECVNHSAVAVATHAANHPETNHRCGDVWSNAPEAVAAGRPVGLLWASPDCRHFSRARGAAPVSGRVRSLAWVVVKWARELSKPQKPRVIMVENVAEFVEWGPTRAKVGADGKPALDAQGRVLLEPVPERKGETFRRWCGQLRRQGYKVEWRVLDAADFGAACRRKRLFIIARRDGLPVCWPEVADGESLGWTDRGAEAGSVAQVGGHRGHVRSVRVQDAASLPRGFHAGSAGAERGSGQRTDHAAGRHHSGGTRSAVRSRCAADIIDWTDLGSSIFDRKKPLAEKTLARIAEGIRRYVLNDPSPFVLRVTKTGGARGGAVGGSVRSVRESMPTQTTRQDLAVATPLLATVGYGEREGQRPRVAQVGELLGTCVNDVKQGLVSPLLAPMTMSAGGPECKAEPADRTLGTVLTRDHRAMVAPVLTTLRPNTGPTRVDEAMNTVTACGTHAELVAALMVKFYGNESGAHRADASLGTVTTKDRHSLVCVMIDGTEYVIVDILFRMLKPSELADAMGFPESYVWPKTQREAVRLIGNAVSPPMAEALVRANFPGGMARRKVVVA